MGLLPDVCQGFKVFCFDERILPKVILNIT
nr:MAG TPA: hypothetical protein [Caudoviricetes sp.]